MSWGFGINESRFADAKERIREAKAAYDFDQVGGDEAREQANAAEKALVALIETETVVGPGQGFRATLGGHSNPGHEPREGWANDTITVSLSQV